MENLTLKDTKKITATMLISRSIKHIANELSVSITRARQLVTIARMKAAEQFIVDRGLTVEFAEKHGYQIDSKSAPKSVEVNKKSKRRNHSGNGRKRNVK